MSAKVQAMQARLDWIARERKRLYAEHLFNPIPIRIPKPRKPSPQGLYAAYAMQSIAAQAGQMNRLSDLARLGNAYNNNSFNAYRGWPIPESLGSPFPRNYPRYQP